MCSFEKNEERSFSRLGPPPLPTQKIQEKKVGEEMQIFHWETKENQWKSMKIDKQNMKINENQWQRIGFVQIRLNSTKIRSNLVNEIPKFVEIR